MNKSKKIVVGLSGGVDSSTTLFLLKQKGWKPVAVTLELPVWENEKNLLRENICCTRESIELARKLCRKLEIPYHLLSAEKSFKKEVIDYFVKEIKQGRTPNPCLICNRFHKFPHLLNFAEEQGIGRVATGHYAKKNLNEKTGLYELRQPKDKEKDQTYYLSYLTQDQLEHIVFPLADLTKKEVRKKVEENGLAPFVRKKESQNFCFVAGKCLNAFLAEKIGERQGKIVNAKGETLGKHAGVHFYTLGQRKGLGLSGGPYYVKEKKKEKNLLVVTKKRSDLQKREIGLEKVNWIAGKPPSLPLKAKGKIRYRHSPASCRVSELEGEENGLKVVFDVPQFAPTPGQFCVFYKKNTCLGGGMIK